MSFISGNRLKKLLEEVLGNQFKENRIAQAGYELTLGDEYYRTDSKDGIKEKLDEKKSQISIEPGQFALLVTHEKIKVPNTIMGFISIKFSQKKRGLVNISGFHVDPGFSGKIKFSVYNAGPATITLDRGAPFFVIWFSELSEAVEKPYNGQHSNQEEIDGKDVSDLKGELASPSGLLKMIKDLEDNLNNKIKDLERKKIENKYLITLLIGAAVAICLKLYWDNRAEQLGYERSQAEKIGIEKIQEAEKSAIKNLEIKTLQGADTINSAIKKFRNSNKKK